MIDRTQTQSTSEQRLPDASERVLTLTVAHHPDPAVVGVRRPLPPDGELVLGRGTATAMPGALDDGKVSRAHARIVCARGSVRLSDLGSRNGTSVDGVPISDATLTEGQVVGIGRVTLLLHRARLKFTTPQHPRLVGIGDALAALLEQIAMVAGRDTHVMVVGETGTGKELVAREIHASSRRRGPLVPVNCGGLAESLLASELFGHVRGAFTGANQERRGLIDAARGGTLFLDEVADASPGLQVSLLRLLETGDYRPVGSDQSIAADVRYVAACQPDVAVQLEDGRFRRDLWTRLARWVIEVPPLRARREDIPTLASRFAARHAGSPVALSQSLVVALMRHSWPGNVRELDAFVERLVVAAPDAETLELPAWLAAQLDVTPVAPPAASDEDAPPGTTRDGNPRQRRPKRPRPDRATLEALLARHEGSVRATAADLAVSRRTLYRWIEALGLDPASHRE